MTVWKIAGEAANDSGGGDMVVYAITPSGTEPPDIHAALAEANPRDYAWYAIREIRPLCELPTAWDRDHADPDLVELLESWAELDGRWTVTTNESR